jgi:hypothetical protein
MPCPYPPRVSGDSPGRVTFFLVSAPDVSLILWYSVVVSQEGLCIHLKEITCHLDIPRRLQFRPFKYSIFPSKIQDSTHLLSVRGLQEFSNPMLFLIREVPMRCHRCGGIMVYEKFYGPHEQFLGWRCIFCGEIVDEVILENRFAQRVR